MESFQSFRDNTKSKNKSIKKQKHSTEAEFILINIRNVRKCKYDDIDLQNLMAQYGICVQ